MDRSVRMVRKRESEVDVSQVYGGGAGQQDEMLVCNG